MILNRSLVDVQFGGLNEAEQPDLVRAGALACENYRFPKGSALIPRNGFAGVVLTHDSVEIDPEDSFEFNGALHFVKNGSIYTAKSSGVAYKRGSSRKHVSPFTVTRVASSGNPHVRQSIFGSAVSVSSDGAIVCCVVPYGDSLRFTAYSGDAIIDSVDYDTFGAGDVLIILGAWGRTASTFEVICRYTGAGPTLQTRRYTYTVGVGVSVTTVVSGWYPIAFGVYDRTVTPRLAFVVEVDNGAPENMQIRQFHTNLSTTTTSLGSATSVNSAAIAVSPSYVSAFTSYITGGVNFLAVDQFTVDDVNAPSLNATTAIANAATVRYSISGAVGSDDDYALVATTGTLAASEPVSDVFVINDSAAVSSSSTMQKDVLWGSAPWVDPAGNPVIVAQRRTDANRFCAVTQLAYDSPWVARNAADKEFHGVFCTLRADGVGVFPSQTLREGSSAYVVWPTIPIEDLPTWQLALTASGKEFSLYRFDYGERHCFAQHNGALYISGANLTMFDGVTAAPAAFQFAPEIDSLSSVVAAPASALVAGQVYGITAYYERIDAQGKLTRSDLAKPRSVSVAVNGDHLQGYVWQLAANWVYAPFTLRLAITQTTGTIYYRSETYAYDNELLATTNPWLQTVDITQVPPTPLVGTEVAAYTTGGVLAASRVPSSKFICSHKNRLALGGCEEPTQVWLSTEATDTVRSYFNEELVLTLEEGGPVTGLASFGDKLIIFKQSQIYALLGDGPLPTGVANDWQVALVADMVGCVSWKTVVETTAALFFANSRGIWALNTGMAPQYVGKPVEDSLDTSAILGSGFDSEKHEVFWATDRKVFVYNIDSGQWATFAFGPSSSNYYIADVVQCASRMKLLGGELSTSSSNYLAESEAMSAVDSIAGAHADSASVEYVWESPWICPKPIAQDGRLYSVVLNGKTSDSNNYDGAATIDVVIYYDNSIGKSQSVQWAPLPVLIDDAGASAWSEGLVAKISPRYQKSKAHKIRMKTRAPDQTIVWYGMTLEIGARPTTQTVQATRRK